MLVVVVVAAAAVAVVLLLLPPKKPPCVPGKGQSWSATSQSRWIRVLLTRRLSA